MIFVVTLFRVGVSIRRARRCPRFAVIDISGTKEELMVYTGCFFFGYDLFMVPMINILTCFDLVFKFALLVPLLFLVSATFLCSCFTNYEFHKS